MKNSYTTDGSKTLIHINHKGTVVDVVIDSSDFEIVNQFPRTWTIMSSNGYKYAFIRTGGRNSKYAFMHRLIMGDPENMVVDHINRNTLDNRKSNLRIITKAHNAQNIGVQKNNKSGYRGVHPKGEKWRAQIRMNGKSISLGTFEDIEDAALAVKKARAIVMPYSEEANLLKDEVDGLTLDDLISQI